jgi:hypothetical protein
MNSNSKVKVGDVVVIARIVTEEDGWDNVWIEDMDESVGMECIVTNISDKGINIEPNHPDEDYKISFGYPPSSLELVTASTVEQLPEGSEKLYSIELSKLDIAQIVDVLEYALQSGYLNDCLDSSNTQPVLYYGAMTTRYLADKANIQELARHMLQDAESAGLEGLTWENRHD